jgi:elongation factor Tu
VTVSFPPTPKFKDADNVCADACEFKWPEGTEDTTKLVMPGDNVEMVMKLLKPIALQSGDRFNVRESGKTVATGLVTRVIK